MGKRIVVLGAGAIGGYVGAHMTRAGEDVTLVDPWPEHVDQMNRHGMKIDGLTDPECLTIPVKAIHMTEMQHISKGRPIDIGICSVKSYDTEWACFLLKQYLAPDAYVVSLQNCMNEETVARTVGAQKTIGCIASTIAAELVGPGHIQRNVPLGDANHAVFRVGEMHGRVTSRAQEFADLIESADTSTVTRNLWGERWTKLIVNSMRNGLSAATAMSGRERDSDPVTRDISLRIGAEAVRVGWALGYRLEKVAGMRPEDIVGAVEGNNAARKRVDEAMDEGNKKRNDAQRPSMGQDMHKGRRTEIELINGFVAGKGDTVGIATPANKALVQAVKRVEKGEIPASKEVVAGV